MKTLRELLKAVRPIQLIGTGDQLIDHLSQDSRHIRKGGLFVAVEGFQVNGHAFIDKAIEAGAVAIVAEVLPVILPSGVTFIQVADSKEALGKLADIFFDHPSSKMKVVGVTGTNGKTSTVTLLYSLFTDLGFKAGLIGTVENRIGESRLPSTHTTPDPVALHDLLNQMVASGCDYVFMEVSSHAADQERIAGIDFDGGVFTNISHDHLDYHQTFSNYITAKKKFFDKLPDKAFALVNVDDKRGGVMVQNTRAKVFGYSLLKKTDFKAKMIESGRLGLHLELEGTDFFSPLMGRFNGYNLLAVYAIARLLGRTAEEILPSLSRLGAVEGRFEQLGSPDGQILGIVDYAHTPDALEKVLRTLDEMIKGAGNIIVVVGCGGNRDQAKRPEMGKIAAVYADQVILTSDNPRKENPDTIIDEMMAGVPLHAVKKVLRISNRKEAIRTAVRLAKAGDCILVAGKGHEKYQEIMDEKFPFDDKKELKEALEDFFDSMKG